MQKNSMELFKGNTQTYATRANAIKKFESVAEKARLQHQGFDVIYDYLICVNEAGRFYPVLRSVRYNKHMICHFIHNGICSM